jgi:hypothetical protein
MLIFISFIVMFASAYFWPKAGRNFMLKENGAGSASKKRHLKRKKLKPQSQTAPE